MYLLHRALVFIFEVPRSRETQGRNAESSQLGGLALGAKEGLRYGRFSRPPPRTHLSWINTTPTYMKDEYRPAVELQNLKLAATNPRRTAADETPRGRFKKPGADTRQGIAREQPREENLRRREAKSKGEPSVKAEEGWDEPGAEAGIAFAVRELLMTRRKSPPVTWNR
ncbi:hypothetical protein C8R44DRAFT_750296 [Mycena epipterygia]|nr:hypothetical protein C8R44DRAFT_750296 [Mycena epipterygia]